MGLQQDQFVGLQYDQQKRLVPTFLPQRLFSSPAFACTEQQRGESCGSGKSAMIVRRCSVKIKFSERRLAFDKHHGEGRTTLFLASSDDQQGSLVFRPSRQQASPSLTSARPNSNEAASKKDASFGEASTTGRGLGLGTIDQQQRQGSPW